MFGIQLDRESEIPLKRQLYLSLKEKILEGRLGAGDALPSTRELAKDLHLSRTTVMEAYEMLLAEGFVTNRQGALARVSDGVSMARTAPVRSVKKTHVLKPYKVDFKTGQPDLTAFPFAQWQKALHEAARSLSMDQMGYLGPQGLRSLREEIGAWLFRSRGLQVDPEDLFICAGATHALHLIADLLCESGREMLMEDPCHIGMLKTFLLKKCDIRPIPVDEHGIMTDALTAHNPCGVYVTPSHQFPLGSVLPADRRVALLHFARKSDIYVVEDDYDSEYRYAGDPIAPLYAMDPHRVIYVGTFSKILFPALRIGYVILPRRLQAKWRELRTHADVQNPILEQATLAEFLRSRRLDLHIRKMTKRYGERRRICMKALKDTFGKECHFWGDAAGLHLAVQFEGRHFDESFRKSCIESGIRITPVSCHCIEKEQHTDKLLLGYGHLEPGKIVEGVRLLHQVMG